MAKSSYEQLGNTCGLPSPVESEYELLDFSSEAFLSGFARDGLSRTPRPASPSGPRGGGSISPRALTGGGGDKARGSSSHARNSSTVSTPSGDQTASKTAVIACYGQDGTAPRIETVPFGDPATYIDVVSLAVMNCVTELGGGLTPEVVFELVSNLAHAEFSDPVISVLDLGDTVRIADSGPGIPNKSAAMRPGFTSAPASLRALIRGAGAGLPLVRSLVEPVGGFLVIDDNIGGGTVVTASVSESSPNRYSPLGSSPESTPRTIRLAAASPSASQSKLDDRVTEPPHSEGVPGGDYARGRKPTAAVGTPSPESESTKQTTSLAGGSAPMSLIISTSSTVRGVPLSDRQREVLAVVADSLEAGPSTVSSLLDIPLSTAYRDLIFLEDRGLVSTLGGGKRQVTGMGMELLRVY